MGRTSPTQRSLKLLRSRGYEVAIVEKWNPYARVRVDVFGFVDLLAVRQDETLLIQTTSYANISARRNKILSIPQAKICVQAGNRIIIHGWKKKKGRWMVVEEDVSSLTLVTVKT